MVNTLPPINIQLKTQYRYQHRPHPKINPTRAHQTTHARIHQGPPGLSAAPRFQKISAIPINHRFIRRIHTSGFKGAIHFKFLTKMTTPMQAHQHRIVSPTIHRIVRMRPHRLVHLPHRQIPPRQIRR